MLAAPGSLFWFQGTDITYNPKVALGKSTFQINKCKYFINTAMCKAIRLQIWFGTKLVVNL